ncbi:MAG TPA: N-acetyl-D-Glu racemase DgcA [Devosiaceae bacterium]|jgi:L-alanine-DL-glutamate epimerase-like enolase superfamily enzyme
MRQRLAVAIKRFPIAGSFVISRGAKTEAAVVTATVSDGALFGRGECVPYARYGETVESTAAALEVMAQSVADGLDRRQLQQAMPAGAARNALDCALWDLEAKRAGRRVAELAGLGHPAPVVTAFTISLGTPDSMAAAALRARHLPLLKLKLGGEGDVERLEAVRVAVPGARLVVDANEAWTPAMLEAHFAACAALGVELIEQPLPAGADAALAEIAHPVPVCADESIHGLTSLAELGGRYEAINIKLDKTGGLTEALELATAARAAKLDIMVGCMVGTSLAMAPALLLAGFARWVDLDGPLLLAADRTHGLRYVDGVAQPADVELWG